jgi:hypothetical protein
MGTITRSIANNIVTGGKLDGTDGLNGTIPASNIADASLNNITSLSPSLGSAITSVSVDPPAPAEGQMWYNSSSGTLKGYVSLTAGWTSAPSLNTARRAGGAATGGTPTATLYFGGYSTATVTNSESYNGSAWTATPAVNTAAYTPGGTGTQTAALKFGGEGPPQLTATEKYNGTSWTSVNSMNTARYQPGGAGIQTAALAIGGAAATPLTAVESYNGTSWTTITGLGTSRYGAGATGTQTSAIAIAGGTYPGPLVANTELWNGTSWTALTNNPTAGYSKRAVGPSSAVLVFGGGPVTGLTQTWNGTTWATLPTSLTTARSYLGGCGSQTAALAFGGATPTVTGATESYNGPGSFTTKTITV